MAIESITQIPGILAGHYTDAEGGTGCTVIICPAGAVGGVDVRGGAPATRETDLLRPEETVQELNAVVLSGGSAFGLAASCGVANALEEKGIGVDVGVTHVPIVSSACVFDLACGSPAARPDAASGAAAVTDAYARGTQPLPRGNVGAGTGCTVGKIAGPALASKAGLGEGICEAGALVCGAVAAVNALGDVRDPATGQVVAGVRTPEGDFGSTEAMVLAGTEAQFIRTNTTVSCIVTNAQLTKAKATKVAQIAADAYAHVIRPVHTTNDGDTIFVMATGELPGVPVDAVALAATRALESALVDAALQAESAHGFPGAASA